MSAQKWAADAAAGWFQVPQLTRGRIIFAFAVAAVTDGMQVLLGPAGFFVIDEVFDVVAMLLICRAIGFHPLLLPTFILELVPVADLLPTWVGCTSVVLALRRHAQGAPQRAPKPVVSAEAPNVPPRLLVDRGPISDSKTSTHSDS